MIHPRTKKHIDRLDPKVRNAFTKFAEDAQALTKELGMEYLGVSGNRTWAEQDALYAKGRTKPGPKVTNAKGGQSNHNFGIAMDFGVFKNGKYLDDINPVLAAKIHRLVAQDAADYGLDWGGNWESFSDEPHYEYHTGLTMAQKRAKYKATGSVL
jgi:peptidoglycan LD-endopeptidase CwlK